MAVDANVIILERVREELRKGKDAQYTPIEEGYSKAFTAIFDGHVTSIRRRRRAFCNLEPGLVKGFGITLMVGLGYFARHRRVGDSCISTNFGFLFRNPKTHQRLTLQKENIDHGDFFTAQKIDFIGKRTYLLRAFTSAFLSDFLQLYAFR